MGGHMDGQSEGRRQTEHPREICSAPDARRNRANLLIYFFVDSLMMHTDMKSHNAGKLCGFIAKPD